jgi:hypothetical protein
MYTASDYRQSGMPTLAEVSTAEAGYEFAARMGFRESACVLATTDDPSYRSYGYDVHGAIEAADRDPLARYLITLPGVN